VNLQLFRVVLAIATIVLAAVAFYPALALRWSRRLVLGLGLAGIAALTPFLLPPEWVLTRFSIALFAGVMIMKMWDLHIGAQSGSRPNWREFLGFIASPALLVWRKRAQGRLRSVAENARDLVLGLLLGASAIAAMFVVWHIDWTSLPFLLQHVPIAVSLFCLVVAVLDSLVALTRLLGGQVVDANDRPFAARTPAEFWRRYNRLVGQFLHEDFFKPMRGLRHPVRSTLAVFAVSGLLHEYLFWMAIGHSAGLQMSFFMLQGCGVALTLRVKPTGARAIAWSVGTFLFNALTSVFFFASIHLALPIYQGGLPAWLRDW
jgi:hypothetical protein